MDLRMLRGRSFTAADRAQVRPAIVSEELEHRLFPLGNAVGRRLVRDLSGENRFVAYEIIGVVENARQRAFTEDNTAAIYVLDRQFTDADYLIVRTARDPVVVIPQVRQAIQAYDPAMVVTSATTMEELVGRTIADERFRARLSTVFGGAALILAAIGLYSLASRHVEERRREIAVRLALGALPMDLRRLVLRETALVLFSGMVIGLPAALVTAQLARALLFGVTATAPHTFVLSSVALCAVALTATLAPAHRASRTDPMSMLRE